MPPVIKTPSKKINTPSGRSLEIRAFTGFEEKMLLTARSGSEADQASAMWTLLENCVEGEIEKLTSIDAEFIFMHIMSISVSPTIKTAFVCSNCEETIKTSFPISDIKIPEANDEPLKIEAGKDENGKTVTVVFYQPSFKSIIDNVNEKDKIEINILYDNLEGIYVGDVQEEDISREEFSTWFLGLHGVYGEAIKFLVDQPKLSYERKWKCVSCNHKNHTVLRGYRAFF